MFPSPELPDCHYPSKPILIPPFSKTPIHSLYLSNLDDQKFLRFSIKYLYLFKKSVSIENLKFSLSKILVDYYPLAGRLRISEKNDEKLEIYCNGEGALFSEAFMDISSDDFLSLSCKPNRSWRKLLYRVETQCLFDIPPLVIQVTSLRCGGMILSTAIHHSLCDGIGTSQFLHAWSHIATKPNIDLPITPFHTRHVLNPRNPPQVNFSHPEYTKVNPKDNFDMIKFLQSQPLIPTSLTFTSSEILRLKRQCVPSLKCSNFEALASHTWRCWVKTLDLNSSINVKLLFSVNIRKKVEPEIPEGYYGNGFVLGCAQTIVRDLVGPNLHNAVMLVQQAKSILTNNYVRSMIDLLEDKSVKTDLFSTLVISQWSKLGLEDLDFGEGKPLHMGPLTSDIYCLFLPVSENFDAVRVLVSMPENMVDKFEYYMKDFQEEECNIGGENGFILKN